MLNLSLFPLLLVPDGPLVFPAAISAHVKLLDSEASAAREGSSWVPEVDGDPKASVPGE